jgi:hypothetical protein
MYDESVIAGGRKAHNNLPASAGDCFARHPIELINFKVLAFH